MRRASAIRGELWRSLDKRQPRRGNTGLQQPVTIMGDVVRLFPMEIAQMPFDGEGWKVAEQDLGGVGRFLGAPELGECRRPDRERLKMIGIEIQLLARPGQGGVILPDKVM